MRKKAIALVLCGFFVAVLANAANGPATPVQPSMDSLTQKIAALEQRIALLEAQIKQQVPVQIQQQIPITESIVPLPLPERKVLPKGWHEQQFNGMSVYVVPANKK